MGRDRSKPLPPPAGEVAAKRRVRVIGSAHSLVRHAAGLRGDPITLTLGAPRLDLSREAGEVR